MTKGKKILFTVIAMIAVLFFFTLQGAALMTLGLEGVKAKVIPAVILWVMVILAILVLKLMKKDFRVIGFRGVEEGSLKKLFYLLPLIIVGLIPLTCGIDMTYGFSYILACLFFTLAIGFAEEVYFRGIICNIWLEDGYNKALTISAVLFAICHCLQALGNPDLLATILAICFAFFYGILFVEIFLTTKSLWVVILLHLFHDFCSFISKETTPERNTILAVIQTLIVLGFIAVLHYRRKKMDK